VSGADFVMEGSNQRKEDYKDQLNAEIFYNWSSSSVVELNGNWVRTKLHGWNWSLL